MELRRCVLDRVQFLVELGDHLLSLFLAVGQAELDVLQEPEEPEYVRHEAEHDLKVHPIPFAGDQLLGDILVLDPYPLDDPCDQDFAGPGAHAVLGQIEGVDLIAALFAFQGADHRSLEVGDFAAGVVEDGLHAAGDTRGFDLEELDNQGIVGQLDHLVDVGVPDRQDLVLDYFLSEDLGGWVDGPGHGLLEPVPEGFPLFARVHRRFTDDALLGGAGGAGLLLVAGELGTSGGGGGGGGVGEGSNAAQVDGGGGHE